MTNKPAAEMSRVELLEWLEDDWRGNLELMSHKDVIDTCIHQMRSSMTPTWDEMTDEQLRDEYETWLDENGFEAAVNSAPAPENDAMRRALTQTASTADLVTITVTHDQQKLLVKWLRHTRALTTTVPDHQDLTNLLSEITK